MANESIDELVQIGELAYATPDIVVAALKNYGEKLATESLSFPKENLEEALHRRHDPCIDFALARYGGHRETLKALYAKSGVDPKDVTEDQYLRALRIAVLSNRSATGLLSHFPDDIIGEVERDRIIREGSGDETYAIFTNPRIASYQLKELFLGEGIYGEISDKQRRNLVMCAGRNPRINEDKSNEHGPDMSFWDIHKAIPQMIGTVPTTASWLYALEDFFDYVNPFMLGSPEDESIMASITRWQDVNDFGEHDRNKGLWTPLSLVDEFCCELASMFGYYANKASGYSNVQIGSLQSDSLIERCAYYGNGQLTVEQMDSAKAKDEEAYLLAIMQNANVLNNHETRHHLEEKQISGDIRWVYRKRCNQLSEHLKYFDPKPVSEWMSDEDLEEEEKEDVVKPAWAKDIEDAQVELGKLVAEVGKISNQTKSYVSVIIFVLVVWGISRYF